MTSNPPNEQRRARTELKLMLQRTIRTGTITLSSGKTTDFYIDGRLVTLDPQGLRLISQLAWEELRGRCDAVGGPTSGADPIVAGIGLQALAAGVPLRLFFTRKEPKGHGMKRRIEGPELKPGDQVVLVDDVATSGGSLVKAVEAVREDSAAKPTLALVVVDRQEGAREALAQVGVELISIFTRSELLERASC